MWVLAALVVAYYARVYHLSDWPQGHNPLHPIGWWGWWDQSKYRGAALAFASLDFSSSEHWYPPLYAALGALFVGWVPSNPFLILNVACLLIAYASFVKFASRYVHLLVAHGLFLTTVVLDRTLFNQYVIPWASTPSAALLSLTLVTLFGAGGRASPARMLVSSALIGLTFLTRPLDAVFGSTLVIVAWCAWIGRDRFAALKSGRLARSLGLSLAMLLTFLAFVAVQYAFNRLVHGSWTSPYEAVSLSLGIQPTTFFQKFYSLFINGGTVFLEQNTAVVRAFPWLLVSLPALVYALLAADVPLRAVAVAVTVQWVLYFSYSDLVPENIWRFHLIHYLKWSIPYLALMGLWVLGHLVATARARRWLAASAGAGLVAGLAVLLCTLSMRIDRTPIAGGAGVVRTVANQSVLVSIPAGQSMDFLELTGPTFSFEGEPPIELLLDGARQVYRKDFRWLKNGESARLLLAKPRAVERVEIRLRGPVPDLDAMRVSRGNFSFELNLPGDFWAKPFPIIRRYGRLNFTDGQNRLMLARGWSGPEGWGVWSDGARATIQWQAPDESRPPEKILLRLKAFLVSPLRTTQRVEVKLNGVVLGTLQLQLKSPGDDYSTYELAVPAQAWRQGGQSALSFELPDAVSPKAVRVSGDTRRLGIGLVWLELLP